MNKRRCGSCRFFQEAGLAGSGWCHHPQRRTTSDVMIMVRRNELACRDEWSHDLWAARGQDGLAPGASSKQPRPIEPFPARRVAPASPDEIAAVIQTDAVGPNSPVAERTAEDVVLGEARLVAEAEPDWAWEREDGAATREADTRTAIIKAREAYRERSRTTRPLELAESTALDPDESSTSAVTPPATPPVAGQLDDATDDSANGGGIFPSGAEVSGAEETRDQDPPAEPDDEFDVVPERVPDFDLPRARSNDRPGRISTKGASRRDSAEDREPLRRNNGLDPAAVERAVEELSRHFAEPQAAVRPGSVNGRWGIDVRPGIVRHETAFGGHASDARPVESDWDQWATDDGTDEPAGIEQAAFFDPPVPVREQAERDDWYDQSATRVPEDHWPGENNERVGDDRPIDEGPPPLAALSAPVVTGAPDERDQPIDLGTKLWPKLPRICRTCRDFRPAEGGGRGWCANEWAFTHRRVVDPADAMPCETSLGSWWLPCDEVWLAAADVSEHGQPTPILDAVEAMGKAEPLRQRQ